MERVTLDLAEVFRIHTKLMPALAGERRGEGQMALLVMYARLGGMTATNSEILTKRMLLMIERGSEALGKIIESIIEIPESELPTGPTN